MKTTKKSLIWASSVAQIRSNCEMMIMKAGRATTFMTSEGLFLRGPSPPEESDDLPSIAPWDRVDIVAGTFRFRTVRIVRAIIVNASAGKKPRTAV